jgi:hypothetical protein
MSDSGTAMSAGQVGRQLDGTRAPSGQLIEAVIELRAQASGDPQLAHMLRELYKHYRADARVQIRSSRNGPASPDDARNGPRLPASLLARPAAPLHSRAASETELQREKRKATTDLEQEHAQVNRLKKELAAERAQRVALAEHVDAKVERAVGEALQRAEGARVETSHEVEELRRQISTLRLEKMALQVQASSGEVSLDEVSLEAARNEAESIQQEAKNDLEEAHATRAAATQEAQRIVAGARHTAGLVREELDVWRLSTLQEIRELNRELEALVEKRRSESMKLEQLRASAELLVQTADTAIAQTKPPRADTPVAVSAESPSAGSKGDGRRQDRGLENIDAQAAADNQRRPFMLSGPMWHPTVVREPPDTPANTSGQEAAEDDSFYFEAQPYISYEAQPYSRKSYAHAAYGYYAPRVDLYAPHYTAYDSLEDYYYGSESGYDLYASDDADLADRQLTDDRPPLNADPPAEPPDRRGRGASGRHRRA